MFRKGDLKFLKILILRIRSIKTRPKIKKSKKKVGKDLINGIGNSEGLKVSTGGQMLVDLKKARGTLMNKGNINDKLLGEKFGTTEEM